MNSILSDTEVAAALAHARDLAAAGVPLFVAGPDPSAPIGFALPRGWQGSAADPGVVDAWRPGMALCAVMGQGIDLLDIDPRNGGNLDGLIDTEGRPLAVPTTYGIAATPSAGIHAFIRSLGCGSRDNVSPGIDVKSGLPDGTGRGFAFLAPTVRPSKVTGEPTPYRWLKPVDLPALSGVWSGAVADDSGAALAARVTQLRSASSVGRRPDASLGPRMAAFLDSNEPQAQAAADRAISTKLHEVATFDVGAGQGFRQALMRAAMTLGGYIGGGYLGEIDARTMLEEAVTAVWGIANDEDQRWIDQGLDDGARRPFYVYTPEDEQRFGDAAQAVASVRREKWSPYPALGAEPFDPQFASNDQDHAEAVAARMAPVMRYAPSAGVWLRADHHRWVTATELERWALATLVRMMPLGDPHLPAKKTDYTDMNWQAHRRATYRSSAGCSSIGRKLRDIMLGNDHPATLDIEDLDSDPTVLWAGGVPWDLAASVEVPTVSSTLTVHDPHLHTARYLPEAVPTPAFDAFCAAVWPDPEVRAWSLRVLSVSLAGHPDAVLPVLFGPGRTGKTAIVSLLLDLLGTYGVSADPRLLSGADNAHASIVYALKGARLAFIDEGPRRGHLATERLKQLTGGAMLTGNEMRMSPVTFTPTHTLVMTTNEEPPITDPALEARLRVLPCESDPAIVRRARQAITPAIWAVEAPGVLARLMRECAVWLGDRDTTAMHAAPAVIRAETDEMVRSQSPVDGWVEGCTVPFEAGTEAAALYLSFVAWFKGNLLFERQTPPSQTAFGRRLTELGYPSMNGFGPRRNNKGRPLAVMGGGPMWGPPVQSPNAAPSPTEPAAPAGTPGSAPTHGTLPFNQRGGADGEPTGTAGSGVEESDGQNPRSTTLSSYVSDSSESTSSISNYINETTHTVTHKSEPTTTTQGNRGSGVPTGCTPDLLGALAQSIGIPDPEPDEAAEPTHSVIPFLQGLADAEEAQRQRELPARPKGRARLTDEEKAERAAARKAIKAAEKAVERAAKVAELAGPMHALPVVVDRAGRVVACSAADAAGIVAAGIRADGGALTVDVETSGVPVGHREFRLRTVQLGNASFAAVFDPTANAAEIRALLESATILHAHSATADLVPLANAGLLPVDAAGFPSSAWARMVDSGILANLADPALVGDDSGLKQLSAKLLGEQSTAKPSDEARSALFAAAGWLTDTEPDTPIERNGWAQVPSGCETMARYAASDVLDTALVIQRLPALAVGPGTTAAALLDRERATQRMTARLTHTGVPLDGAHVATKTAEHTTARDSHEVVLTRLGIANPGSPQQVAAAATSLGAVLPKTKTGAASASKAALEALRGSQGDLGELVGRVLDYRHHATALKMFLVPYNVQLRDGDGRIRPTIYTLGTDTGRMSAARPNIQQLSREGGIRACIVADPGQLIIGADFSGVELRVAAALSGDPELRQIIADQRDLHWEVARMVFGPDATKSDRYNVKRMVFGRLYGGGIPTLAQQCGVSESITASVVDSLDAMTPTLSAWSGEMRNFVKRGGRQFPTYSGRIIYLPGAFPHKAPNYAIQGTARELTVDAMLDWAQTPWADCTMFPVHDEIDVMVPAQDAEAATNALVTCMTREINGVKIVAEPSAPSPFWADSV